MKTYYNLFKKGRYMAKTTSIKVAKNLEQLGWRYCTIRIAL